MENEEDVLNLNEDADYMSGDELMDENGDDDEAVAVEDTLMSTAETRRKRGGKRRHSRCWKHFAHYMCLTAHYIDGNWDLKSRIIDFCAFPPPHTGGAIAMKIVELLKDWGLEKRVFSVTVDNASSNDNMQSILRRQLRKDLVCNGEFFHIRCVAHILNLIVQDGLSVISGALEKIRESVKFVNVTESRERLFQSCVEAVAIKPRNGGVLPGLVMDVATRWNSTHLMLDRAIIYREAFRQLAEVEACYQFCPNELEWERAELIRDFLAPFAEMTNLISGSSYPTANLYFMQVWMIENWLRGNEFSGDEVICEMVASMKPKFDKYWEEYSDILAIAAVLDPRLKFACLEYCFTTLDASTSKTKVDHIRKKLKKLFDVYKKNTRKNVAGASRSNAAQTTLPGYDGFYAFISQNVGSSGKSALDKYLEEPILDMASFEKMDVLSYWKENANRFKELSAMACDVLSIPITTVASESSFSIGSRVLNKYRSSLLPSNVRALICARNWLRGFESLDSDEVDFKPLEEVGEAINETGQV